MHEVVKENSQGRVLNKRKNLQLNKLNEWLNAVCFCTVVEKPSTLNIGRNKIEFKFEDTPEQN